MDSRWICSELASYSTAYFANWNRICTFALRLDLRDITSGYRAFHREVLENIDLNSIHSQGYCFQIEVALRAHRTGYSIAQVPITFVERVGGVSKMSKKIVAEALWNVTKWGFGRYQYRR